MFKTNAIKQISISFEDKKIDQEIAKFIKSKKCSIGISDYIKELVKLDMKKGNLELRKMDNYNE